MREVTKDGRPDGSCLCFGLDDYVEERLASIGELAGRGVDGICLDILRQPQWPINGLNAHCGMDNHSGLNTHKLSTL